MGRGTVRRSRMVEGSSAQPQDGIGECVRISEDVFGCNSQHFNALHPKPFDPGVVPPWTIAEIVGSAVDLDR